MTDSPLEAHAWRSIGDALGISEQETRLLEGLFHGKSIAAMAEQTGLSASLTSRAVGHLCSKIGVRSRRELGTRVLLEYLMLPLRDAPEEAGRRGAEPGHQAPATGPDMVR